MSGEWIRPSECRMTCFRILEKPKETGSLALLISLASLRLCREEQQCLIVPDADSDNAIADPEPVQ